MKEKNTDYITKNTVFQFVICALMFLFVFALSKTNANFYKYLKENYSSAISENITKQETKDVFYHIGGLFKDSIFKEIEETENGITAQIDAGGKDISASDKKKIDKNVSLKKYKLSEEAYLPINGVVTSPFGFRTHPISGEYGFHSGIDIAAEEGTKIRASFDGEIIKADYNDGNGNFLKIKHGNSVETMYCHCQKLLVKEGDKVKKGEVIATEGTTGYSTGPHLHFEIRIDGISYNPEYILKDLPNEN